MSNKKTNCHCEERPKASTKQSTFLTMTVAFILDRTTKLYLPVPKYYNEGAAFGILQGQTSFLAAFSAFVLVTLIIFTIKENKNLCAAQKLAIGMILGGTAGNLFDRVCYGYVIDFISLNFIDFPVFNLADVFINTGALILLLTLLFRK